jgi:hypothetical protein
MKIFGFDDYQVLNESFKSGKLRNIIQQHGMPKYEQDRKFLYDLQDDEILGVMDFDEWYDFHRDNKSSYHIALEDGKYLVLGNIDTLKYYADDKDFQREFKKRRDERHPGNELNDVPAHERQKALEDEATKHFREKKAELEHKRNIETFKANLGDNLGKLAETIRETFESNINDEIADIISEYKDKVQTSDISNDFDVKFLEATYTIGYIYDLSISDGYTKNGTTYYDVTISPKTVNVYDDELGDTFNATELFDDPSALLADYDIDDVEGEISDYYDYYGVSRGDFF